MYVCLYVLETADLLDGMAIQSDTQTSQQTDMNETYYSRTWQADPSKLHGFVNRLVSQDSHGEFKYSSNTGCHYNIILGAAIFFHRFYLYVRITTDLPKGVGMWLGEVCSCCCLTVFPGSALGPA